MRPHKQQIFRTDAAAKLDQLELVAALLERDATNNRTLLTDLGYSGASGRRRSTRRPSKLWKAAAGIAGAARRLVAAIVAFARSPRTWAALYAIYAFVVDFAVVLAAATAAVLIVTAAFLLTAPPE